MTKLIQAGVSNARIALVGNDGLITGNTTTLPSSTAGNPDMALIGIQDMTTGILENDVVPVPGDDGILGGFIFESAEPRTMMLNTGQQDFLIDSTLQGTNVVTIGGLTGMVLAPVNPEYVSASILVSTRLQPKDAEAFGAKWKVYYYPLVTISPMDVAQLQGRTAASFRYKAVAQTVTNYSYGTTITGAVEGTSGIVALVLKSNYPMAMIRFTGAGSAGPYTGLTQTPSATASDSIVVLNRTVQATTAYTFSTTNKTITMGSSVASGVPLVVLYAYTD